MTHARKRTRLSFGCTIYDDDIFLSPASKLQTKIIKKMLGMKSYRYLVVQQK